MTSFIGIWDIWLETNIMCKLQLKDIGIYLICSYMISTGTLDEKSYHNYFRDGKWKLSKNSLIVAKRKKIGLYMSQVKEVKGKVNAIEDVSTNLWHKWFGQLSEKGLHILSKKNYIPLKCMNLNTCTHYFA